MMPRAGGAHALSDVSGKCDLGMLCGARDTRPSCEGGRGGGCDSDDDDDDDDDDGKMGPYADSGESGMGLEAGAGTILKTTKRRRKKNRGVGSRTRRTSRS
jgi:hypothetical protein